jgi:HSP20 family protein
MLFDELFHLLETEMTNKLNKVDNSINHKETEDDILVRFLVPGFNEKNLSVVIEEGRISIKGKREDEFSSFNIDKSYPTPKKINLEKTKASIADGILTITFPKKEDKSKTIKLL